MADFHAFGAAAPGQPRRDVGSVTDAELGIAHALCRLECRRPDR
ncbi:hypothetical protein I545_3202 [Mycobacterium kansasii 662]|uniref:Uncharacterized protein n=2 Tax=Mycobacterium kansasii TaxID=1768 RepID=A0A1V3XGS6_MYCKA|nr:hypothetical protein I547_3220 [Mycobacterium kansasii 824]EUA17593.1 hypothetical protein I545_3202 [Mycobacterium kansasii 662]KEP39555.1 hypothetical protein MKSMC1_53060 [Mycobacterium kansasii]OOK78414.1 hypothetical protein BZL30_3006 [Mycobacterium kansasii]